MTCIPESCKACGEKFRLGKAFGSDNPTAGFPYCFNCYHGGGAFDDIHAELVSVLKANGLQTTWWNTGGGCWLLVVLRAGAPMEWEVQESGFVPFVFIAEACEDSDGWHVESGAWDPGADVGAVYCATEEEWCGENGGGVQVAPATNAEIVAFALERLPNIDAKDQA